MTRTRFVAAAVLLYTALTIVLTWPLATRLFIMDPGDSAFFAWEIGWELHALVTEPSRLPHGNIFHPLKHVLGMDEPVLGTTILVAPLYLFTQDAVVLFNVARLLTFVASGLTACALARELGCRRSVALLAGAAFAFSPIRTDQLSHLSTLGTQWLPLVLLFLFRYARTARIRDAVLSAVFYVLAFHACGYHGLLGVLILPAVAITLFFGRRRLWPGALVALLVAAAGLFPIYRMHRAAMAPQSFVRADDAALLYSASLETFLAVNPWNNVYGELTSGLRGAPNNLFPGAVLVVILLLGTAAAIRARRGLSREGWALVALVVAAVLVALGPEIRVLGTTLAPGPIGLARRVLPAFAQIRVSSRAGIYLALGLTMLAAMALQRHRLRPVWLAALGLLLMIDGAFVPVPTPAWMTVVDSRKPPPPVYTWLAAQPGEFAIVELPILRHDGYYRRPAYDDSTYMVWSTLHWKRLVNGYAGLEPYPYSLYRDLARRFPSQDFVAAMRGAKVRYIVVHRAGYGPNQWQRFEQQLAAMDPPLPEAARFGEDVVYSLE